ncbi:MAG: carboxypeptidase regulatory-like domain-containing protein [Ectothiorhodospiraceae bacterium]|nr:carboxypeptidase regulatory-like domain-containing protein [Ectothiorhodospiraceae bacterium]
MRAIPLYPFSTRAAIPFALFLITLALSGCFSSGSSGGGSDGGGPTTSVTGLVTDPPIAGAAVNLVRADGSSLSTIVSSDRDGRFTVSIPQSADTAGATVRASGGRDTQTGYNFQAIELLAPLDNVPVIVSPLTTLVSWEMENAGLDVSSARAAVADRLGLPASAVLADPADHAGAQLASLKTVRLAAALRSQGNALGRVAEALSLNQGSFEGARGYLEAQDFPQAVRNRLHALGPELALLAGIDTSGTATAVIQEANRVALRLGVAAFMQETLGVPGTESADDDFRALADALWEANGRRGVPSDGAQIGNLVRYALQAYELDPSDFGSDDFALPGELSGDAAIAGISMLDVIDHRLPLAPGEELGMDNASRLAYFYASDLSPFYRAERLFDEVLDDNVRDPLFSDIAEGQALIGDVDAAVMTVETRIFQAETRARTFRGIGRAVTDSGAPESGAQFLDLARQEYDRIVEAQGLSNLTASDANFYLGLIKYYLEADATEGAEAATGVLMDYVDLAAANPPTAGPYNQILAALWRNADDRVVAYVEGEATRADAEAGMTPFRTAVTGYNASTTTIKALYLYRQALLDNQLGNTQRTWDAIQEFHALRQAAAPSTIDNYLRYLAPAYADAGRIDEYLDLVENTISSASYQETARLAMRVYQARNLAIDGHVTQAVTLVTEPYDSLADQLQQLTYLGVNRSTPYLGLLLLQNNEIDAAREVLEAAWDLLHSEAYVQEHAGSTGNLMTRGCLKIASLYADFISQAEAGNLLGECPVSTWFAGADAGTRVQAHRDHASAFADVGRRGSASTALQRAVAATSGVTVADRVGAHASNAVVAARLDEASLVLSELQAGLGALAQLPLSSDLEARQTLSRAALLSQAHANAANGLRALIAGSGNLSDGNRSAITTLREQSRNILMQSAGGWQGYRSVVESLPSPSDRATQYKTLVDQLSRNTWYDDARQIIALSEHSNPDRNTMRGTLASREIGHDAFPGTLVASRDLDGDGRPDFFDPSATEAQQLASPLMLDDDIDGDGIPDTSDRTPFCAHCSAAP